MIAATHWATVCLALGERTVTAAGTSPAKARDNAIQHVARDGWRPSAVCVQSMRRRRSQIRWWGFDGKRWRKGGWCPGCCEWRPRTTNSLVLEFCECGDALWWSPLDPGPAKPEHYSRGWTASKGRS